MPGGSEALGVWGVPRRDGVVPGTALSNVPGSQDDAAIIGQSIQDPEYFAALFLRHAPQIQRYVVRRIGIDAAEDVVAETFLAAFRQRGSYRLDRPEALPWLYGIATNLIGRHRRTELSQLRLLARTGADPVTAPFTADVEAAVSASGARARIGSALARLPASHRDALLLVAWGDLSYQEVATATGVPLGTVQSRISRARRKLRQSLADLGPEEAGERLAGQPRRHALPEMRNEGTRDE
jgi:RNA polymerase sigma factor (sigma-70 family)